MGFALQKEPPPLRTDKDGTVRVGRTRVTLDTVVEAFSEGLTAEEIAQQYPSLDLADVYAAIAYYLRYRDHVEAYLAERAEMAAALRKKIEARCPPAVFRERLLARVESESLWRLNHVADRWGSRDLPRAERRGEPAP